MFIHNTNTLYASRPNIIRYLVASEYVDSHAICATTASSKEHKDN